MHFSLHKCKNVTNENVESALISCVWCEVIEMCVSLSYLLTLRVTWRHASYRERYFFGILHKTNIQNVMGETIDLFAA